MVSFWPAAMVLKTGLVGSMLRVPLAALKLTPVGTVVLEAWAVPLGELVVTV